MDGIKNHEQQTSRLHIHKYDNNSPFITRNRVIIKNHYLMIGVVKRTEVL